MILKGRTRADGARLANYLLSSKNEQVRVLDIFGTVEDDRSPQGLKSALRDMDELSKMTRAKSSLFHLALNPSDRDRMTADDWKYAVVKAEKALGLEGQPRAVVSHTYQGKEHLHVVWSRVDVENRKCVEMNFSNLKLCKAAREIELELGLQQTPARARGAHKLNQHIKDIQLQQDARASQPREERNAIIRDAWNKSHNGAEFKKQIEAAGFQLAKGKRGVLVVDQNNEPHSISRCVKGIKAKDVKAKLADLAELPTVEKLRADPHDEISAQRQRARNMTKNEAQREGLAANDNTPQITPEQARHLTQSEVEKRLEEEKRRQQGMRFEGR